MERLSSEERSALMKLFVRESNPEQAQRSWQRLIADLFVRLGDRKVAAEFSALSFAEQEQMIVREMPGVSYGALRSQIYQKVEAAFGKCVSA